MHHLHQSAPQSVQTVQSLETTELERQQVSIEGELEIVCQACGFSHAVDSFYCISCGSPLKGSAALPNILKPGSRLRDGVFSVGRMLGQGGFGITYLGSDVAAQRPVAIKEFFPSGCARSGSRVVPSGPISPNDFNQARQRFVEEGELLSRFKHPGIVRVYSTFEENETAYIVMELLRGKTLDAMLQTRGGRLPEEEAVGYIMKLGEALEVVHRAGLLHRDIKPQNIMVTDDNRVVLLDFGTARKFAEGILQKHTVQVTPGYAPLELYSQRALRGPFTDVYSMGATMYYLLSGEPPVPSMDRAVGMPLTDIRKLNENVTENVGSAVMQALNMDWSMRPQEVSAFTSMLNGTPPRNVRRARAADGAAEEPAPLADVLSGHTSWVRSLAFSPDGLLLASGSDDKTVRIWNVASLREVRCIKGHTGWVRCLGFASEPNHVLSGSRDHTVRYWNLLSGGEERRVEAPDGILALDFSPNGKAFATGSWDSVIRVWDYKSGEQLRTLEGHNGPVASVAYSPDGRLLASAGLDDCTLRLWDVESGAELKQLTGHWDWMSTVLFSPDGGLVVSASYDNTLRLWNSSSGKEVHRVEESSSILAAAFSPDGATLAYGTWGKEVVLWDVKKKLETANFAGHTGPVCAVTFSPDASIVASGSHDRTIRLWRPPTPA